jgi:Holliday junction resolvasome RuvABC endonuclease subunit
VPRLVLGGAGVTTDLGQQALLEPEPTRTLAIGHADAWWGVDPSTLRISIGVITRGGERRVRVKSFPRGNLHGARLDDIYVDTLAFARETAEMYGLPGFVYVEQPFAYGHPVPPVSYMVQGVIMAAIVRATGAVVESVPPPKWKATAVGNGNANKAAVMEWARLNGCPSDLQDDADAWAIAEAARRTVRFV